MYFYSKVFVCLDICSNSKHSIELPASMYFSGGTQHCLRVILGVLQTIRHTNILSQHENKAFFQLFFTDTDMSSAVIKK